MIEIEEMAVIKINNMTGLARSLGVTYPYLWQVLSGHFKSPALVLKIWRECPRLFKSCICKIPYKQIVAENKNKYRWDNISRKYILIRGRKNASAEAQV